MRKSLLTTTALVFAGALAAGSAAAAEKLQVGVGGYMEQWVGFTDIDDASGANESVVDIQSDSEIYFQGSLESDMGLKFGINVQLEGNQSSAMIDESFVYMSGAFGRLEIGARDPIDARMHYSISDVGILLQAGDSQKWIPGAYLDTAGWGGPGDNKNVIYISPRVSGVQFAVSYGSDAGNEDSGLAANNDNAVWAMGANFNQSFGDATVKFSVGHRALAQTAQSVNLTSPSASTQSVNRDDQTWTNVGLGVSMSGISVNLAYAMRDNDGYMANAAGDATVSDPSTAWDVMGISVVYSDGPMAVSVAHMNHEVDDGTARTGTMFSASYNLAPGVDAKGSILQVEDDTRGYKVEGTALVVGLDLGF